MKTFNKLVLVTAVAAFSTSSFAALQSIDESQMSDMTGQDGITLSIQSDEIAIANVFIHDTDGLAVSSDLTAGELATIDTGTVAIGQSGVIAINDLTVALSEDGINVVVDTEGGDTGAEAFINANVQLGDTTVSMGAITVSKSGDAGAAGGIIRGAQDGGSQILSGLDLSIGASSLNIQLGNQPQGSLAVLKGTTSGGITIKNLGITDSTTTFNGADKAVGDLYIGEIRVVSGGEEDLTTDLSVAIDGNRGLLVAMGSETMDIALNRVGFVGDSSANDYDTGAFGNTQFIGDIELQGLDLGSTTIAINGHSAP